ncbi:ubiquinone biosynthesis protein UbiE [Leisingera sp. ANG-M1]|uniref:methyltransferase domain-containing protein n=1 Tax=Leisingera sp. ANG-M1 TaxID=1577895 RepID=UPI00057CDF5E|nr:methyltransferase domain-containing protein [Leisingera sp. ANG-M1]KIC07500.1 ubiquinone biosynthesis protein UbiE [Leisingera sp. ANG-M1]
MLNFDEETTRLLEDAYQGADVSRRRRATFDALAPEAGEHILDLGCGNGLLTLELSRAVGPGGHVTGLDASPQMLAAARQRINGRDNVTLVEGHAARLPFGKASFDKAAALQLFEYLTDRRPALRALHQVLKPGGLLVVGDIHWDTLAWHSDNTRRMERMLEAWGRHMAERALPALLPSELRTCGYRPGGIHPVTICDTALRPDGLAAMMIQLIRAFAVDIGAADADDAEAWVHEQQELAEEGRFFLSLTHFVCTARRI